MQNKKTLLQRLLVIYITFFIVLVASIAHSFVTDFYRGATEGVELGEDLAEKWSSGTPRMIYMLDAQILKTPEKVIEIPSEIPGTEIRAKIRELNLLVEQDAPGASPLSLAFRSIGGSSWLYFMIMLCPLFYLVIIIFMFMIIHSLRRSIREERTLDKKNVWYLRIIGLLTIASELITDPGILLDHHHGHPDPLRRRGLRYRPEPQRGAEAHHIIRTHMQYMRTINEGGGSIWR